MGAFTVVGFLLSPMFVFDVDLYLHLRGLPRVLANKGSYLNAIVGDFYRLRGSANTVAYYVRSQGYDLRLFVSPSVSFFVRFHSSLTNRLQTSNYAGYCGSSLYQRGEVYSNAHFLRKRVAFRTSTKGALVSFSYLSLRNIGQGQVFS